MKKKKLKIFALILIIVFTISLIEIISKNNIISNNHNDSKKSPDEKFFDEEEIIDDKPLNIEHPKSASPIELEQNYTFSFNTSISETWNQTWTYSDYTNNSWINQNVFGGMSFQFNISNLRNASNNQLIDPTDLNNLWLLRFNGTDWEDIFAIDDAPGLGNGTAIGDLYVEIEEAVQGVWFVYSDTGITFDAIMYMNATRLRNIKTEFIPTIENTKTDLITWELRFFGFSDEGNYSAILQPDNFTDFTVKNVLAKEATYWKPLDYIKTSTNIVINGSYLEYLVELQTPNYLSIVYNDNLTLPDNNELRLFVTCNMGGNLTIYFRNSTGDLTKVSQLVNEGDDVDFNYIMYNDTLGGVGSLEISLINKSTTINFGIKTAEIMFYKNSVIGAFSQNTTAFSEFFVLAAYWDTDKLNWLYYQNSTGKISKTNEWIMNQSVIHNATVTYDLEGLFGELDFGFIPGINFTLYNKVVDLKEFQIVPGEYNLTFIANRIGYATLKFITPIVISKKDVYVDLTITPTDKILTIEETFAITIKFGVSYPTYYETFLRIPVNITFSILKDGKLDDEFLIPNVIESYTLSGPMTNDSIPGDYILNISIVSEYYNGSASINATVVQKELEISVEYSGIITESINKNFTWNLEAGDFNKENMTVDILIDGVFIKNVSLASNSSGYNLFSFTPGVHNITYRLISPFYTAEETIEFTVQALPSPDDDDDDDDDDKEENILLLMIITLILIGVSILAIFMVISRHKVKAQRELESELIALKTKTAATEQKISLIETQISEIASIYWVLVVHSEQGVTMIEIADFKFENVIDEEQKELIGKGVLRDSALIGGFLTAIRNFSRETSGTSLEYQPVFNSQTDYSTIVNDNEIHRRILEGTHYFMAFVSSRETMEISDVLSFINSKFELAYGEAVKNFDGAISPFRPFEEVVIEYLHKEIKELQKKLIEERLVLEQHERHLREVQEKIGIKPKKLK